MEYRYLGSSGLKVSAIGLGTWITFAAQINVDTATECIRVAIENGINYFDVAESHSGGQSQIDLGIVFRRLQIKRSDIVVSTNIFWGGKGPNDRGLSRKHIIEGLTASLKRMQLDYVDIVFAQRPDLDTPMEEIVRAFNWCIDKGMASYWGTSEWPAHMVIDAINIAKQLNLIEPVVEQPQYNMLQRERTEKEFLYLIKNYRLGIIGWSPLGSGVLTGKYNDGIIPSNARLAIQDHPVINRLRAGFFSYEGRQKIEKVKHLVKVAKNLNVTPSQLAIAWCLKNNNISSVITGASHPFQIEENAKSIQCIPLLTNDIMHEIEKIIGNKPEPIFDFRSS
ncbi:unnamed protein product [Cunninghamella blakesleeana]